MAVIGNSATQQAFTPAVDYFSGNGSTTAFTLSRPVASVAQVEAVIDNVVQNPSSAYTVSSNTITFTSAPLSGTNNIYVRYTSPITQVIAPGQGTVNTTQLAGGTVTTTADATLNGLTVGKGGGSVSTNTAVGASALNANTTGANNTAVGYLAGYTNSTGVNNVAVGGEALKLNTTDYCTAVGYRALLNNSTGARNTAFGHYAGNGNTTGGYNTFIGSYAGESTTTGSYNTVLGYQALDSNIISNYSTAVGYQAKYGGTGGYNTCFGALTGYSLTTGQENTLVGYAAGYALTTGSDNVFIGSAQGNGSGGLITTGSYNAILGNFSGNNGTLNITTASNNIVLSDGAGNVRMSYTNSDTSWRSVEMYNNTSGSGANMVVLASGTIARSTSSLKYKRDVQNATHGLAEVLQLRPVTYKGKSEKDGDTVFGGLIAEEVHAVGLTEFVQYAEDGTPDALAYGNMVSLLVKSIQELKSLVDAQATEIAELKAKVGV